MDGKGMAEIVKSRLIPCAVGPPDSCMLADAPEYAFERALVDPPPPLRAREKIIDLDAGNGSSGFTSIA